MAVMSEKRWIDSYISPELWNDRAALEAWLRTIVQGDLDATRRQLNSVEPLIECHAEPSNGEYKIHAVYRTELGGEKIPASTKFFFHDSSKWPMERA